MIRDSGLPCETNAMFTNIEGDWDEVMAVVKRAVFAVAETSPRVGLVLKADLRAGHDTGQLTRKVERIEERLAGGRMRSDTFHVHTGSRDVVHDITRECADFVRPYGDGLLHVFVPHATAGIAILETGAGSDDDLLAALADLLPADDRWRHRHGLGRARPLARDARAGAAVRDGAGASAAGCCSGPGRASAWSISTSTTPTARSGCRSWKADCP